MSLHQEHLRWVTFNTRKGHRELVEFFTIRTERPKLG